MMEICIRSDSFSKQYRLFIKFMNLELNHFSSGLTDSHRLEILEFSSHPSVAPSPHLPATRKHGLGHQQHPAPVRHTCPTRLRSEGENSQDPPRALGLEQRPSHWGAAGAGRDRGRSRGGARGARGAQGRPGTGRGRRVVGGEAPGAPLASTGTASR